MQAAANHNQQKKIAVINDFSGFGRCSIAVTLPIISVMGIQCCPLPTAVFSNHTGFPSFYCTDMTEHMEPYAAEWEKLGLTFSGIATGFLGSAEQIDIVHHFLDTFKAVETKVLIDPVMGDYGKLYPTYSPALAARMAELIPYADLLTPNLTEACILTGTPYRTDFTREELCAIAAKLGEMGAKQVVISGLSDGDMLGNLVCSEGSEPTVLWNPRIGDYRSGTGDVFSAILAADLVNGVPLEISVKKAADFISRAIAHSIEMGIPKTDGICFEDLLKTL